MRQGRAGPAAVPYLICRRDLHECVDDARIDVYDSLLGQAGGAVMAICMSFEIGDGAGLWMHVDLGCSRSRPGLV